MNWLIGGLFGLAAGAFTSLASAQQASPAEPGAPPSALPEAPVSTPSVTLPPQERENLPPPERRWYGWQTLSIDGAATAMGLAALALVSSDGATRSDGIADGLLLGGAVAYGAGGPTVHLIHRHPWQALGSFGMRAGLPIVSGALGRLTETCPPPDGSDYGNCGLGGLLIGASAGALLAIVLDNSLLAWEQPRSEVEEQASFGLAPVVSSDGRRELRVIGTF